MVCRGLDFETLARIIVKQRGIEDSTTKKTVIAAGSPMGAVEVVLDIRWTRPRENALRMRNAPTLSASKPVIPLQPSSCIHTMM